VQNSAETVGVRLAELVATLSYAADLGLGLPMRHCMRRTVIALRMADLIGVSHQEREATFYTGLLMNVYCHADAAEQASWFGDDLSFKGEGFEYRIHGDLAESGGSRVHRDSLDEGGAQLYPCGLATATTQHVTVASQNRHPHVCLGVPRSIR
jgi:hypothetical protein